jgi:arylsulfatase
MHLFTHTKKESLGRRALAVAVPRHDDRPRQELSADARLLDELGIADDTFVMYSTDNGPHRNTWPDGGMTPFRSEKNTNWEGAFRIPLLVRWPGRSGRARSPTRSCSTTTGCRRSSRWPARRTWSTS